jgi:hypothetical protein
MRPYPADSTNNLVVGTNMPLTMIASYPNDTQRTNAFNSGSVARLRQVSFPDFNITHVDQESLSAVIPIEAVMTSLNFNRSDIKSVHFSIPHAESYGLTTENLLQEALHDPPQFMVTTNGVYLRGDTNGVISVAGAQMAYSMFRDILYHVSNNSEYKIPKNVRRHMEQSATRMNDKIYLALISEVFFARSMDIMIDRKTAAGASVSAKPISSSELQQLKTMGLTALHTRTNTTITTNTTVSASSTNGFVGTKAEMIDVTEGDTALDLAKKLRDLETPDGIGNIGGSVRVLSVSASSIGLRRTFLRPICVGVRGIIVKIDVTHPEDILGSGKREWMRVETSGN